jgi:hypothetical protein
MKYLERALARLTKGETDIRFGRKLERIYMTNGHWLLDITDILCFLPAETQLDLARCDKENHRMLTAESLANVLPKNREGETEVKPGSRLDQPFGEPKAVMQRTLFALKDTPADVTKTILVDDAYLNDIHNAFCGPSFYMTDEGSAIRVYKLDYSGAANSAKEQVFIGLIMPLRKDK